MTSSPLGPGFLIFFQQESIEDKLLTSGGRDFVQGIDRRLKEDEEILLFVQLAVSYKLI